MDSFLLALNALAWAKLLQGTLDPNLMERRFPCCHSHGCVESCRLSQAWCCFCGDKHSRLSYSVGSVEEGSKLLSTYHEQVCSVVVGEFRSSTDQRSPSNPWFWFVVPLACCGFRAHFAIESGCLQPMWTSLPYSSHFTPYPWTKMKFEVVNHSISPRLKALGHQLEG